MNKIITVLILLAGLCSAQGLVRKRAIIAQVSSSPITFDSYTNVPYSGPGAGGTVSVTSSGTNIVGVLLLWSDSTPTSVTCDGNAMTLATNHALTVEVGSFFIYTITGITAGTNSIVYTGAGQALGGFITVNNARQTSEPDAIAPPVAGVSDGSAEDAMPITTLTDQSFVIGVYASAANLAESISSNGTYRGSGAFGFSFNWTSTTNATPAGSFVLQGKGNSGPGINYEAIGVSIAPL